MEIFEVQHLAGGSVGKNPALRVLPAQNKHPRNINFDLENCNFKVTFDFILMTQGENPGSNCIQKLFCRFLNKVDTPDKISSLRRSKLVLRHIR